MNIIIDASPLGIGLYHPQAKTGVGRVVEQLVSGLWESKEVNLLLAAPTHLAETSLYIRKTFGRKGPSLVNRPVDLDWALLENALLWPMPIKSLPTKAIRELFYWIRRVRKTEQAHFEAPRLPAGAIYHSPFYAIPPDVARMRHVKKVLTIHDLIPIHHPEWFPAGEKSVRNAIDQLPADAYVVTVSEATKTDFCVYSGFDPARVTSIHLAASPELFYPVTDRGRIGTIRRHFHLGDHPYLLCLATLEPRKNIDHLIRCFLHLVESRELPTEIKLVLVGTKGWKMDRILAEIVRNESVRERLVFTGFVPDEELAPLYAGALAFLYPSRFEGFGLPPLEAMQCGVPVICSNIASLQEVVGNVAIQVPPTDVDALCQAILTLVRSEALRTELAAKSLHQADRFSWKRFVNEHIVLYKTLSNYS